MVSKEMIANSTKSVPDSEQAIDDKSSMSKINHILYHASYIQTLTSPDKSLQPHRHAKCLEVLGGYPSRRRSLLADLKIYNS